MIEPQYIDPSLYFYANQMSSRVAIHVTEAVENATIPDQNQDIHLINIEKHKTSNVWGSRHIMVFNTVLQVLKKISKLPPSQSLHVFKKYNGDQMNIPNLMRYIEAFEKRMCLPLWRPKDFRNFMTETTFKNEYQDKIRFLLKHSKSSQEHSYAPRRLLDEEIEAFIYLHY